GLELFPLREEVPVEVVVEAAVGVGEAVFFLEREAAAVEAAEEGPAALGAEVECQQVPRRHGSLLVEGDGDGFTESIVHRPSSTVADHGTSSRAPRSAMDN